MPRRRVKIIVSCEHAGHRVPPKYRPLFRGHARVLTSIGVGCGLQPLPIDKSLNGVEVGRQDVE